MKTLFLTLILLINGVNAFSYTVYPSCPDFTDITSSHVEAFYGDTDEPLQDTGLVYNRHVVIDTTGTDPNTGGLLQVIAPGETRVVRLGNDNVGFETEALRYHFNVDIEKSILEVKFAVVFEDPGHPFHQQPRFRVRIMDAGGNLLGDCSEYDVTSGTDLDGFNTYNDSLKTYPAPIRWRDWSSLLIDLSRFAGQEVQVEFITYDCGQGAHFGYAYFTATCMKNQLVMDACTGTEVTLEAPGGFASYLWDNNDITQATTRVVDGSDMELSCLLTNEMGCYYTLYGFISGTSPFVNDTVIQDTICQGLSYVNNNFTLAPHSEPGIYTYYNTVINPLTCTPEIDVVLDLLVYQRFYDLSAAICFGEDYTENGFSIIAPPVGIHNFQEVYTRTGVCDSIVSLDLIVNTSFTAPTGILGDASPCQGEALLYYFNDPDTSVVYNWTIPENATLISGQGSANIYLRFNDTIDGQIGLYASNGCGNAAFTLDVDPQPSYHFHYLDTICTGNVYDNYGFILPQQDSIGNFVYRNEFETTMGCDSNFVLSLIVHPSPEELEIVVERDSFICEGDSVTLHAISSEANYMLLDIPKVAIGDILCTDGTTIRPSKYAASGKTAKGIIFHIDETGEHGWAVSLTDMVATDVWSTVYEDVPGIVNRTGMFRDVYLDMDGYNNTQFMLAQGTAVEYPAAYNIDYVGGWFLPSAGQIKMYFEQSFMMEDAADILSADTIDLAKSYLTSTEFSSTGYITFFNNSLTTVIKTAPSAIRPMIAY